MHEPMVNVCLELKGPVYRGKDPKRILSELPDVETVSESGKGLERFCQVTYYWFSFMRKQIDLLKYRK